VRDNTTNLQTVLGLRLQLVKWDATLAIAAPMQALLDAFDHEPEIGSHMTKVSTKIRTIRAKARKSISEYQTVEAFVSDVRLVLINACHGVERNAYLYAIKRCIGTVVQLNRALCNTLFREETPCYVRSGPHGLLCRVRPAN